MCRWCFRPLEGRRTVYCSKECDVAFARQHFWPNASRHARQRAKGLCERCHQPGEMFDNGRVIRSGLEVNHIEPVRGGKRFATCLNHADNLEVLCRPCHLEVTEEQFRPHRAAARLAQRALVGVTSGPEREEQT